MEGHCSQILQESSSQLAQGHQQANQVATDLQGRAARDQAGLEEQRVELQNHMDNGCQFVHNFLREELCQDVPTGGRDLEAAVASRAIGTVSCCWHPLATV